MGETADTPDSLDLLEAAQRRLAHSGRLRRVHWLIIATSFLVTILAWYVSQGFVQERAENRFLREAEQIVELIAERLERYEDALWGGVAAIVANDSMTDHEHWQEFALTLDLPLRFPNISALNVVLSVDDEDLEAFIAAQRQTNPDFTIHPAHEGDLHLIVTHVVPEMGNEGAIGYDAASDPARLEAFMQAARSNSAQLTPPVQLVQDEQGSTSFVLAAPFYDGMRNPGPRDRARRLQGFVVAPFVLKKLVNGVMKTTERQHAIRLQDGDVTLYDRRAGDRTTIDNAQFTHDVSLNVYGRQWQFKIGSSASFSKDSGYLFPTVVLFGGLAIDVMLLGMFLWLSRANRRALELADTTSQQLRVQAAALSSTNQELESYAYVVSHDLKTPLRGIEDLATYIQEDLEDTFESDDAHREARRNLERIIQQVNRSKALIEGILDYSGVGQREEKATHVDVASLIADVGELLSLEAGCLRTRGQMPQLITYEVRLGQVLTNLIGNAFKYHHDRANAEVVVLVEQQGAFYRFSVCDNGPGIDRRFHDRIFEAFKTLQSKDEIESTGVGLSIVKKSVELLGGTVSVDSTPGSGTTIHFLWPIQIPECVEAPRKAA